ncbi:hypothetical protein M8494_25330 [Serratia ureilytica]
MDADPAAYPFWLGVAAGGLARCGCSPKRWRCTSLICSTRVCVIGCAAVGAKLARLPLNWFCAAGARAAQRACRRTFRRCISWWPMPAGWCSWPWYPAARWRCWRRCSGRCCCSR